MNKISFEQRTSTEHSVWTLCDFPTGEIVSVYRKGHLFDVELTGKGVSLKESAFTIPGARLVPPVQTPVGKVQDTSISVCVCVCFLRSGFMSLFNGCIGGTGDLLWPALPRDVLGSSEARGRDPHLPISIYRGNRHRPLGGKILQTGVKSKEKTRLLCYAVGEFYRPVLGLFLCLEGSVTRGGQTLY